MTVTRLNYGNSFAHDIRKEAARLSSLGAASWTIQGEEAKNHLKTQAPEVQNINKFGNVSCLADQ